MPKFRVFFEQINRRCVYVTAKDEATAVAKAERERRRELQQQRHACHVEVDDAEV